MKNHGYYVFSSLDSISGSVFRFRATKSITRPAERKNRKHLILQNAKTVFVTNALFLTCSVITSLLSAWALGAEGRGDLAIVTLFPFVCVLITGLGFPYAHRYWVASRPDRNSSILTFTVAFSLIVSAMTVLVRRDRYPRSMLENGVMR